MGAFKEPHGGVLKELYLGESVTEEEKVSRGKLSVVGPDPQATM